MMMAPKRPCDVRAHAPPIANRRGERLQDAREVAAGLLLHAHATQEEHEIAARIRLRHLFDRVDERDADVRPADHAPELATRRIGHLVGHEHERLTEADADAQRAAHRAQHEFELVAEFA